MRLTVCLLTRNEEQNVPRAIGSVRGIADQVVVADTGSTDRTAAVAAELGAEVYQMPWQDDFGAGCNFAIEQARGEWVLWLNPDEEVLPVSPFEMEASLGRRDVLAYTVPVRELPRADRPQEYGETRPQRLFRRLPQIRFVGRANPQFWPPLEELARQAGLLIEPAPLMIQRPAYLSRLSPDKLRWVARMQELELRDRPGRLGQLIDYGHTLLLLNDPRGHEVLAGAVERILPQREAPRPPSPDVQRLLDYLMTVTPEQSRSRLSAEEARQLAFRWFPTSPPLLWRSAEHYFQISEFRAAALLLDRLTEMARTGNYDRTQAFDPAILGPAARMNLGICQLRLGQLDQAEQAFRALAEQPAFREQAAQNLELVRQLREQGQKPS